MEEAVEEALNTTSILDILINIYNSELNYLKLLKHTFEIYAEPLRYLLIRNDCNLYLINMIFLLKIGNFHRLLHMSIVCSFQI